MQGSYQGSLCLWDGSWHSWLRTSAPAFTQLWTASPFQRWKTPRVRSTGVGMYMNPSFVQTEDFPRNQKRNRKPKPELRLYDQHISRTQEKQHLKLWKGFGKARCFWRTNTLMEPLFFHSPFLGKPKSRSFFTTLLRKAYPVLAACYTLGSVSLQCTFPNKPTNLMIAPWCLMCNKELCCYHKNTSWLLIGPLIDTASY